MIFSSYRDNVAEASCRPGYSFDDGTKTIKAYCVDSSWVYPDIFKKSKSIYCHPICKQDCLNGGWCYKPNECKCLPGFSGRKCETKTECLEFIPGVPFSKINRM